jgi:ribonuclease R
VFRFDQEHYTVVGHRTGRRFRLGDEVSVTIKAVDMDRRAVDLSLAGEPAVTTSGKFVRGHTTSKVTSKGTGKGKKGSGKKGRTGRK